MAGWTPSTSPTSIRRPTKLFLALGSDSDASPATTPTIERPKVCKLENSSLFASPSRRSSALYTGSETNRVLEPRLVDPTSRKRFLFFSTSDSEEHEDGQCEKSSCSLTLDPAISFTESRQRSPLFRSFRDSQRGSSLSLTSEHSFGSVQSKSPLHYSISDRGFIPPMIVPPNTSCPRTASSNSSNSYRGRGRPLSRDNSPSLAVQKLSEISSARYSSRERPTSPISLSPTCSQASLSSSLGSGDWSPNLGSYLEKGRRASHAAHFPLPTSFEIDSDVDQIASPPTTPTIRRRNRSETLDRLSSSLKSSISSITLGHSRRQSSTPTYVQVPWEEVKSLKVTMQIGNEASYATNALVLGLRALEAGKSRTWDPRLIGPPSKRRDYWPAITTIVGGTDPMIEVEYNSGNSRVINPEISTTCYSIVQTILQRPLEFTLSQ